MLKGDQIRRCFILHVSVLLPVFKPFWLLVTLMRNKYLPSILSFLLSATIASNSFALPVLSPDGLQLTGVEVQGSLYNVAFADGVYGEVFPVESLTSPGWFELAQAVSASVEAALVAIAQVRPLAPSDIAGCDAPGRCVLYLADTYRSESRFPIVDTMAAIICDSPDNSLCMNRPAGWVNSPVWNSYSSRPGTDGTTLITFQRVASVPAPSSLGVTFLAIVLTVLQRRLIRRAHARSNHEADRAVTGEP